MSTPDDEIASDRLDRYQWDDGDVTIERSEERTDDAREKLMAFLSERSPEARFDGVATGELAGRVLTLTGGGPGGLTEAGEVALALSRIRT
jgi:hypothetical protein